MRHSKSVQSSLGYHSNLGFTLIELVMVIVLLGILSLGAQSLFSSKDAYVDYVIKERLLSMGLLAQQMALSVSANPQSGPAPTTVPATLTVSRPSANTLEFNLSKHGTTVQSYTAEQPIPLIMVDATSLAVGSTATFNWNTQAEMNDGLSHNVSIIGDQSFGLCISSSGYVYEC